jgi:hypothetical protein
VPVLKADGNIRLFGDYKVKNKGIKEQQYPIVSPEETLMNLNVGKEYSKLDMQSAFTQYELDPKSQQCVTIMHNNDCTE